MSTALHQLSSPSPVVRKRATQLVGALAVVVADTLLFRLIETLISEVREGRRGGEEEGGGGGGEGG